MDKRQKSTLRSLHIRIADELILDEDFYAALRRDKIFTNGMLDLIKTEGKPRDRVYKMLELLEKRGPKAFENFVWILKENYEWLAKDLEEQYSRRLQRSQQGRDRNEQSSVQYETLPKYLSNDQYHRYDQCRDSHNRTVSTPNPQQSSYKHANLPAQESVSAGSYNKETQQFFTTPPHNTTLVQQQSSYDSTDNLTIMVPTSNDTNSEQTKKQYKDACMSPIGIIESARKTVQTVPSPIHPESQIKDETQSEADSYDQGFDEIQSQTATVTTSTNDDVESQFTSTTEVQSEEFETVLENTDSVDAPAYECLDENSVDFQPSEVYYDHVRRGSSRFSQFDDEVFHHELTFQDDENDVAGSEISYEHSEAFQYQIEAMRVLYNKFNAITLCNEDSDDLEDDTITWDMIYTETDKLINRLESSDDTKMIRKCYKLFQEKERRQPLNLCIEGLFTDKKEVENRLREKQKEIDDMVYELWKHQQDISNIKKLRKAQADNETEIKNLKKSLDNLEKDADIKLSQIEEKDGKIQELESKLRDLQCDQQRKPGVSTRRGMSNPRRVSNAQGQSPKRQSSYYADPRISLMHGAYSQQSPRNVTTAMRRAPSNRK